MSNHVMKISWPEFKSLCIVSKKLNCQFHLVSGRYRLFAVDAQILYECSLLEPADILEFETSYRSGFNKRMEAVDEDGHLTTSAQSSLLGTGTWIVSDNLCSAALPSVDSSWGGNPPGIIGTTHSNGGAVVYQWAPTSGKKLYCIETQLILSSDVNLSSTVCHFMGKNAGADGLLNFDRVYAGEWGRSGYRVQADAAYEDSNERRFVWYYTRDNRPPIILKHFHNASITLTRAGIMAGSHAFVKIKVIALPE